MNMGLRKHLVHSIVSAHVGSKLWIVEIFAALFDGKKDLTTLVSQLLPLVTILITKGQIFSGSLGLVLYLKCKFKIK